MSIAILRDKVITYSAPRYMIVRWEDLIGVPANSDSTSLIILNLPALGTEGLPNGVSYAFELLVFNIGCDSTDYNVRILNKNDITALNTIYEVAKYDSINLSNIDSIFGKFIIRNRDISLTNKIYLYVENNDITNATGSINIEMIYLNLQNRSF